jgi:CPA2 family monovalent cation:H+ antiporter-2
MVSAITTLLTPYLIKSSDGLVSWFDRTAPKSVVASLQSYTQWVSGIGTNRPGNRQIRRLIRKWLLQLGLNLLLITGLFLVGAWAGRHAGAQWPRWQRHTNMLAWLAAVALALPLLVATFRKLRAVAMVLAEMSITKRSAGQQTVALRRAMTTTITFLVSTALVVWILLLSSTILPPWRVLVALGVVIVLATIVGWQAMVRFYARAQISLRQTLTMVHPDAHAQPAALPPLLQNAVLRNVKLQDNSPARGKLVRELALRTRTGASIVGIERNGESILNPGPDEELACGDDVLLIGTDNQLEQARVLLGGV